MKAKKESSTLAILIDINHLVIANIMKTPGIKTNMIDQNLVIHSALNSIRAAKTKLKQKYGNIIICCDNKDYWRRSYFPYYKYSRKKTRDKSVIDWSIIHNALNRITEDLKEYFPYKVINVHKAEADDVICVLLEDVLREEKNVIFSTDKDFLQLQRMPWVDQFSPRAHVYLKSDDPEGELFEKIIGGDTGDGIPNVLSDSDVFVNDKKRQKRLTVGKKKELQKIGTLEESSIDKTILENFERNKTLIDLRCVPDDVRQSIVEEYNSQSPGDRNKVMQYFIDNRMSELMKKIQEF